MKTTFSTLFFAMFCIAVQAQVNTWVEFTYDASGNRTNRIIHLPPVNGRTSISDNIDSTATVQIADSSNLQANSLQNANINNNQSQNAELAEGETKEETVNSNNGKIINKDEELVKTISGNSTNISNESGIIGKNENSTQSNIQNKNIENNNTAQTFKETLGAGQSISIYPNPTKGALQLSFTGIAELSSASLHLFDLQGKEVYSKTNITEREEINFTSSPAEAYILKIFVSGKTKEWTVIKE